MDLKTCQKVVVFGGSFDPPHMAHVELPCIAMQKIGADALVYIPTGIQPLKQHRVLTPAHHRLAMLRLALKDIPFAKIITDEIDTAMTLTHNSVVEESMAGSPSYTVDTLQSLRQRLNPSARMRLLIGADNLRVFDQWRHPQRVVQLAEPLVMLRPPDTRHAVLASLPDGYDPNQWSPRIIDVPQIDISSTQIRHQIANNKSITGLVPPAVETYIHDHRLYQS